MIKIRPARIALAISLALAVVVPAQAGQTGFSKLNGPSAAQKLEADTGAKLTTSEATGAVRFARAPRGKALGLAGNQKRSDHAMAFLATHGKAFGLRDARSELKLVGQDKDAIGDSRVNYTQLYRGLPVFGTALKAHYDASGKLKVINGTMVPDINVNIVPDKTRGDAAAIALKLVPGAGVKLRATRLMIYRENLVKGIPGANHLAYEVEVGNGSTIREFVYIDAHTGSKIDQITGIYDALNRRAYNAAGATAPGPTYPATPFWVEGQALPTGVVEADNMIIASKETYDLYKNAFGRDSFDGAGATMDSIFNRGNGCPNASWNGTFISFCPGMTSDDVTAHEWSHAYTQYTHGLIYAWQPGALNEAYSDIMGETVDRINGRQTDTPFTERTAGTCSILGGAPPATLVVNSPAAIARDYAINRAPFGATVGSWTGTVQLADDGVGVGSDACTPLVGFIPGNIALMDRGVCSFVIKVKNAQLAGASAVIVANNAAGVLSMGGADATITVPAVSITQATGNLFKANLPANVTLSMPVSTENTVRWLVGEDDTAPGLVGALRDMWNPTCFGNPGKVNDLQYYCSATADNTTDQGGVHSNSGVPNHGYALLVDGGTYNGQTVTGIGLTKAAHIYFRAESVYQTPTTDFTDHADAIEQSCSDLIGVNLADLQTGAPSGQTISTSDCAQVAKMALAVQLRSPPEQCHFAPILAQTPPPQCDAGTPPSYFFTDGFENGGSSMDRWTVSRTEVFPGDFVPRDWTIVGNLPDHRPGRAFFAANPNNGTCAPGGDQSGVLHLVSPVVTVAKSVTDPRLSFNHWVATESGWDGGNLKISVNGGAWQEIAQADFVFNAYNKTLFTLAQGSTDPLAGQRAYSGTDAGALDGSWGHTIINLATYAAPGSKVQLMFDLGTDGCGGVIGWFVDDVSMYSCKRKK